MTGAEFRALREAGGITRGAVAAGVGVHTVTVYRWERAGASGVARGSGRRGFGSLGVPSEAVEWLVAEVERRKLGVGRVGE